MDIVFCQLFHIVFDILCIGGDHGAVVMVACLRRFVPLIGNAGIENVLDALFDQPGNVAVNQLGRIALRLTGDGFDTQLIKLFGRLG